jgi:hypothetical protein
MAATVRPDFLDRAVACQHEPIADALRRLRQSIAEGNAQRRLLRMRDIIRDVLAHELSVKVAAIALTKPGSRTMATPAEIVDLVNDLSANVAQALSEEISP